MKTAGRKGRDKEKYNKEKTGSWGNLHNTFKFWLRVEEL